MTRPRCAQLCIFAPPVTGQTVSAELTCRALERRFDVQRIDVSPGSLRRSPGVRALRNARTLVKVRWLRDELRLRPVDLLVMVPSSSPLGRLRDALSVHALRPYTGRFVARVHSGNFHRCFEGRLGAGLMQRMVAEIDVFVFLSEGLSAACSRWIPAEKRRVVANWIDPELETSDAEAARKIAEAAPDGSLHVAFISNMLPTKGYRELARALAHCRDRRGMRIEADFVGDFHRAGNRSAFERELQSLGLAEVTRVHGAVAEREAIRDLLHRAHVLVLPSRHPVEAQPRAIIEAMASATPIVATPRGAIPEMVFDGVNGYHLASLAPESIADALEKLSRREVWRARAQAARRVYREQFSAELLTQRFLATTQAKSHVGG